MSLKILKINLGRGRVVPVAMRVLNPDITIDKVDNEHLVVVQTSGMRIYSCYFYPIIELAHFHSKLVHLEVKIINETTSAFIGGEFNCKNGEQPSAKCPHP